MTRISLTRSVALIGLVFSLLISSAALSAPLVSVPDAPQNIQATRGNASVTIRWQAGSDGGSNLSAFQIVGTNGITEVRATPAPTATAHTFTGLTNNSLYDFVIRAQNSAGWSAASDPVFMSPSTTSAKVPSIPVIQSVGTSISRTLSVNYILGNPNGSTITNVSFSLDAGVTWNPVSSNPLVISNLTNGLTYALRLRATNYLGNSPIASKSVKAVAARNAIRFVAPASIKYGQTQSLDITQTGGETVVSTLTPAICSVSGFEVFALKPGTCSLRATNLGDADFARATAVTRGFAITKAGNEITFDSLTNMSTDSANQTLSASSIGGTVSYLSLTPTVCAVIAGAVKAIKAGTCTLRASNSGNVYYSAATPVTQSFSISSGTATATPTPTPTATALSCVEDAAQLCGPITNVSISVDGVIRTISNSAVSVPVGRPVRINYNSNSANAGKRVLITLDSFSVGMTSSVPHTELSAPWSSSSCYPDGATTQCQLMLDSSGSGYFLATFTGSNIGSTFEIRQRGPGYTSAALNATFVAGGATPTPTASATPSATASPASGGPWTVRQTTFSNSEFAQNLGDAALWVSNGWYANGLRYGTVHLPVSYTKTVSFNVKDKLGNVAANKTVTLILGKGYSNSTAHVRVGSVTTSGTEAGTGTHQGTVTGITDTNGNVSFAITNLDAVGSFLYTQISAYVANVGTDIVDIINIAYDQAPPADPSPSPTMSLLWQDDFSGTSGTGPNSSYWTADLEDGCNIGNCGWGNGERQWYVSGANKLNGSSSLVITSNRLSGSNAPNCYYGKCEWSSGKITSYGKVNFTYGYLEARIKNPAGGGTWPAFWMLGQDIAIRPWPVCGEIDIMEGEGNAPYTNWGTAHWSTTTQGSHIQGPNQNTTTLPVKLSDDYHTYGILWTPTSLTWYIDGVARYSLNKANVPNAVWPFGPQANGSAPKFYAIFNVAMGGSMGGVIDPALSSTSMSVDYIRYYSVNGQGSVTITP
ncbi:MAG: glycosyl hydrolase family protein [Actinobacteria bacterium]|nr:glycosyl hydrolase family protein [Actinomycetota bacterium]